MDSLPIVYEKYMCRKWKGRGHGVESQQRDVLIILTTYSKCGISL